MNSLHDLHGSLCVQLGIGDKCVLWQKQTSNVFLLVSIDKVLATKESKFGRNTLQYQAWPFTYSYCFRPQIPLIVASVAFLVHLSRRLKVTIVIMCCPSVRRPSVVNFSHFRLLLWNHWTEFNETWQEARTQHPLPSFSQIYGFQQANPIRKRYGLVWLAGIGKI